MKNSENTIETNEEKAHKLKLLKMALDQAFKEQGESFDKSEIERENLKSAIEKLKAEIKIYEPDVRE